MIADKDRAFWIGASDTSYVVGNWKTATFKKWWLEKLGLRKNEINTKAMKCGNAFEHKILDCIGCEKDKQLLFPELALRVNYDGTITPTNIYEVKTHKEEKGFKVSKAYWRQAQVEMFGFSLKYGKVPELNIVSYGLSEREYKNYFAEIEPEKIKFHKVEYDSEFIEKTYIPRLNIIHKCILDGVMPNEEYIKQTSKSLFDSAGC